MKKLLSSQERLRKIVADVVMDVNRRDRLKSGKGNAMLVASSIYEAFQYYKLFQDTELRGKVAAVTSYEPSPGDVKGEETGEGKTQAHRQYEICRQMLADHFGEPKDEAMTKTETFEEQVKKQFVHEPGQMKLLIVVDKLLTGFDAPPATYLYIDKTMRDHGLFQAICRVNRKHSADKEYGYIVDYMDLFQAIEGAVDDYTGAAFDGYDEDDVDGLLKDRIDTNRERLEDAREQVKALCEPVEPPRDTDAYIRYFCGDDLDDEAQIEANARKRHKLYEYVGAFVRAYADLANEMSEAGYSAEEAQQIKQEVKRFETVRQEVKLASGDYVDLKVFEPAMRHLLDTYVDAAESEVIAQFDDVGIVELVARRGADALEQLPEGIRGSEDAVAETIENNVRKVIVDRRDANPAYYDKMSKLLRTLIERRREGVLEYEAYLEEVAELARKVTDPTVSDDYPDDLATPGQRALYDNLGEDAALAQRIDERVKKNRKDDWRGDDFKERVVKRAIYEAMVEYDSSVTEEDVEEIFPVVKNQREY
jgi:type I restriction enzyme R subunit